MIPLPTLSAADLAALNDDMRYGPYIAQPSVQMLDLDHNVLSDLSDRVIDGQVDCKLEGKVSTRTLSLTLADPSREIAIDGDDASDGGLFYDKMFAAGIRFKGPRLGRYVDIPVFCGPMTNGVRAGWQTQITGQGKERLATGMLWDKAGTIEAGEDKYDAIAGLLVSTGEAPERIVLPGRQSRIPKDIVLGQTARAWPEVMTLSESLNRQPIYDGHGDFRVRAWPESPALVFTDGEGGHFTSRPEVTYNTAQTFNGVWVRGPVLPSGHRPSKAVWLPRDHPLSPWSRARGRTAADPDGVPFRIAYIVENEHVRTDDEAEDLAYRYLRKLMREVVNVKVDVTPNWRLEPGDVVGFQSLELGLIEQVMTEFSIPLVAGVSMSLGVIKEIKRPLKRQTRAGRRR